MKELSDSEKSIAVEVLLKMYETKYLLAKQAEDQRATMSNFIITITAVIFAFISQQSFNNETILLGFLTVFLGLFGLFMSAKYSQHYLKNYAGATLIKNRIAQICPEANLLEIDRESSDKNLRRNPLLAKVPTLRLWVALHSTICLIGALCILLALLQ